MQACAESIDAELNSKLRRRGRLLNPLRTSSSNPSTSILINSGIPNCSISASRVVIVQLTEPVHRSSPAQPSLRETTLSQSGDILLMSLLSLTYSGTTQGSLPPAQGTTVSRLIERTSRL